MRTTGRTPRRPAPLRTNRSPGARRAWLAILIATLAAGTAAVAARPPRACLSACRTAAALCRQQAGSKAERRACRPFVRSCRSCCRHGGGSECAERCGDGRVAPSHLEACDAPGTPCAGGDTCSPICQCATPTCGNQVPEPGETCGEPLLPPCPGGAVCAGCVCAAATTVPALVGLDMGAVDATLAAADLVRGAVATVSGITRPAAAVLEQSPAAGATIAVGTPVALTVSVPPDPDTFLLYDTPGVETEASAAAYYAAIDPLGEKTTLPAWKRANRFGAPGGVEASAIYTNHNDLGFGRKMSMRIDNEGVAFAVDNYRTVEEAIASPPGGLLATVTMEWSPPPGGGTPFVKFYTFGPDGRRVLKVDLDGRGEKYQPEVCTPCHGGRTAAPVDGIYPDQGDIGARFIPFDLDSFRYAAAPAFTRAAQEAQLKAFNEGVLMADAPAPIVELIRGWYGGPALDAPFDADFVPSGWKPPAAPDHAPALYTHVVRAACRGCHLQLAAAAPSLGFTTFAQFDAARARIRELVCEDGDMPRARRTFDNFWLRDAVHDPAVLGDLVGGEILWSVRNAGLAADRRDGAGVRRVVADPTQPDTAYALRRAGLARTTDGGASWTDIGGTLPQDGGELALVPLDLAVDPHKPSTLWVAGDGLFQSADGGATWQPRLDAFVTDLAAGVDGDTGGTVAFAADATAGLLRRTSDGGDTWPTVRSGTFFAIATDPQLPSRVYAAALGEGVLRSDDAGDTWGPANTGLPAGGLVRRLIVDPGSADTVYAHVGTSGSASALGPDNGTWRSTDGGGSWTFLAPFAVEPDRLSRDGLVGLAAGRLVRSLDGGARWTAGTEVSGRVSGLAAAGARRLWAAAESGIWRGDSAPCGTSGPGGPRAVATSVRTVSVGTPVALSGGSSRRARTFAWTLLGRPGGSAAAIDGADGASATLTPDVAGGYLVALDAGDGERTSTGFTWVVAVPAVPPVSFSMDLLPVFSACTGCHDGTNVMNLTGSADAIYANVDPRVNRPDPPASAILRKPADLDADHPGGVRPGFDVQTVGGDRAAYDLVERWIEEGAPNN